ncbi:uncharacterized protein MYCGRDRAFT_98084 [Zymoseptoria tritici IPO323]|uniref:Uncharacterized protein n=1 Tax=Zymoseptoria tritici (strain CBS 115943 / IPO323) TaxID=336722 RepID=F9XS94_ZYMTI|nr:uncharacterized protein MYCGRDRAFT_98084 [Zymoseptoria tritici IPO323]EGP81831.1 hypothetical protein MYCGRDRAFT_98084 [Zymoseptoria tritici IPO323]
MWSKYYIVTFRKFCRRNGIWRPKPSEMQVNFNICTEGVFEEKAGVTLVALNKKASGVNTAVDSGIIPIPKRLESMLAEQAYQGLLHPRSNYRIRLSSRSNGTLGITVATDILIPHKSWNTMASYSAPKACGKQCERFAIRTTSK